MTFGLLAGCAVSFLAVRALLNFPLRNNGCDAYYFLLCREIFRKTRRLPIILPELYLLEPTSQSYPPGFTIALSVFSDRAIKYAHWLINHFFDLGVLVLYISAFDLSNTQGVVVTLIYATSPFLVLELTSLTSRPLGALICLTWFAVVLRAPSLTVAVVFGAPLVCLLVLTHKLTTQFLVPTALALSTALGDPKYVCSLLVGYLILLAVFRSIAVDIFRAHLDILRFWSRNLRFLGVHQIRDSPLRNSALPQSSFHQGGLRGAIIHSLRALQLNPWVIPAVVVTLKKSATIDEDNLALLTWLTSATLIALFTLLVPGLRPFGEGTKYVKYGIITALLLIFSTEQLLEGPVIIGSLILAALIHGFSLFRVVRIIRHSAKSSQNRPTIIADLVSAGGDMTKSRFLCLPTQIADLVAFTTRRPVLWGTHHEGFENVEPFFPVLRVPLQQLIDQYALTHLILDESFVEIDELDLSNAMLVSRSEFLTLYSVSSQHLERGATHAR